MKRRAVAALAGCLVTAACASGAGGSNNGGPSTARGLPATEPYLQVTGAHDGYLVWPSASAWLVLHTSDGFRSVENRTPVAIETDGGLVGDFAGRSAAVAVGTTDLLLRSPLLTSTGPGRWAPNELPAGVADSQGAVSVGPGGIPDPLSAVVTTADGSVLQRTGPGWRSLTSGKRLVASGKLRLQTITWLTERVAVVTGTITGTAAGAPVAFRTADGGARWQPIAALPSSAVSALAPCRTASEVVLPVLTAAGGEVMLHSDDAGATWSPGHRFLAATGTPAWGCSASAVWTAANVPGGTYVLVSTDAGRTWRTAGSAPAELTSLAPDDASSGFAASGGTHPTLYAVSAGARRFRPVKLPGWVATIGEQMATS